MDLQSLKSPLRFLGELVPDSQLAPLKDYESWWFTEGIGISEAVDRAGTPWLRMFDQFGKRADEILFTGAGAVCLLDLCPKNAL